MGTVRERYDERLELRYGSGMGCLGLVYGSNIGAAVCDRYGMIGFCIRERYGSSIGAAVLWDLVKSATPMTPLATYFSKSKLMARFQSHQGVRFHKKKRTSLGASRFPMTSSISCFP